MVEVRMGICKLINIQVQNSDLADSIYEFLILEIPTSNCGVSCTS